MIAPLSEHALTELAKSLLDLEIPAECLPGVAANLAVLAEHAARIAPDLA